MKIAGQPDKELIRSAIGTVQTGSECSNVEFAVDDAGQVELSGFISSPDDLTNMVAGLRSITGVTAVSPDRVEVQAEPICQALQILAPYQKRNDAEQLGLGGAPARRRILRDGDALNIALQAPVFDSYLYVDYIQRDGLTVHVRQTPAGQQPAAASQELVEETPYKIGPPFGREIVVIIASRSPLFESARPEFEDAADYLPALQRQLAQRAGRGGRCQPRVRPHRAPEPGQ